MITPISRRQHFTKFERHNVDRWGDKSLLSGQKFDNFTLRGRFFPKKTQKFLDNFQVLRRQAAITPQ